MLVCTAGDFVNFVVCWGCWVVVVCVWWLSSLLFLGNCLVELNWLVRGLNAVDFVARVGCLVDCFVGCLLIC